MDDRDRLEREQMMVLEPTPAQEAEMARRLAELPALELDHQWERVRRSRLAADAEWDE